MGASITRTAFAAPSCWRHSATSAAELARDGRRSALSGSWRPPSLLERTKLTYLLAKSQHRDTASTTFAPFCAPIIAIPRMVSSST